MKKIKEHLMKFNESKGWGISDADLMETVLESDFLWQGDRDEHRWYTLIPTVVDVNGMLLMFTLCRVEGENSSVEDCIGGYKLENIREARPKEITTTIYEIIKEQ